MHVEVQKHLGPSVSCLDFWAFWWSIVRHHEAYQSRPMQLKHLFGPEGQLNLEAK